MTRATLGDLLDASAVQPLLDSAAPLIPGGAIRVENADGAVVAAAGGDGITADGPTSELRRPIEAAGEAVGTVVVSGPTAGHAAQDAAGSTVAAALTLAATEAASRRAAVAVANQTAIALERAALQREVLGRRSLDDELAIGRRIQRSLMPRRFPAVPGWEIAAAYESAREIGGDLFDAFQLRDQPNRLAFAIADVTGKGIPAAILMADARALIHAAADHSTSPAESLSRVNRILVRERATSLFVTVAHGVIDGPSGELRLANAGHDPVHVVRTDGTLRAFEPTGRLIGMVDEIAVRTEEVTIAPGEAIVAHTDGVTEARSPSGAFYGEDRLDALLTSLAGRSASEMVATITADVDTFRDGAEASDDLTLLVIRRLPEDPT